MLNICLNADCAAHLTPGGHRNFVAVPGVIQFVPAGTKAIGGTQTGFRILTCMFVQMGIQTSPAFSIRTAIFKFNLPAAIIISAFTLPDAKQPVAAEESVSMSQSFLRPKEDHHDQSL